MIDIEGGTPEEMDLLAHAMMRLAEKHGLLGDILNHELTPEQRDALIESDARFSAKQRARGVQGF